MNLKKMLSSAMLFAVAVLLYGGITTELETYRITVGSPAQLSLNSDNGSVPDFISGPPRVNGIEWLGSGTRSSTQYINWKVTRKASRIYTFIVKKPGKYVIPAAPVKAGREKAQSSTIVLTAENIQVSLPQNANVRNKDLSDLIFAELTVPSSRKLYRTGEEIPVTAAFYAVRGLRVQLWYPEITSTKKASLFFHDYAKENPDHPRFARPKQQIVSIRGRSYVVYYFQTAVRVLEPGKIRLEVLFKPAVAVREPNRTRSFFDDDDDFFGGLFNTTRTVKQEVRAELKHDLEIEQLPHPPADAKFLGLIGDWSIRTKLSSAEPKVGDALTLTVQVAGNGSIQMLKAPALEFPGFRTYAPEVDRSVNGKQAEIRYILIPTEPGKKHLKCAFSYFNTTTEKYQTFPFDQALQIKESQQTLPAAEPPEPAVREKTPRTENRAANALLYLKKGKELNHTVRLPYYRNSLIRCILIVLAGLIFRILCELIRQRRRMRENDPGFLRREMAGKQKNPLLKTLRSFPPEELADKSDAISAYLNNALNLPPGATLNDAADQLEKREPEFSAILRKLAAVSWAPGGANGFTPEMKKRLLNFLSKMICALFLFVPFADGAELKVRNPDEAVAAYDSGKFKSALEYYQQLHSAANPSPAVYYNIANCLFQNGEYAKALAAYEHAMRLAPRDSDLLENLNLTRRKLGLHEKYHLDEPGDIPAYLRDLLRPDEWLMLICIGIAILLIGDGLRRIGFKRKVWLSILIPGILLLASAFCAIVSQYRTTYAENTAVITLMRSVKPRTLPSGNAPELDAVLSPGEEVHIEEIRSQWIRVRSGETEGWIPKQYILF